MVAETELDASVVPPAGIQLLRLLGAGAYGNLYLGRFSDVDDRGAESCRSAFVKVLVDPPGPEVDRLLQLGHENLIGLRAVVVGTGLAQPSCLVYAGVDDAVDLHQYLILRRVRGEDAGEAGRKNWRQSVAIQVARALDYLASVGLVHRDVATRNVVVSTRDDDGGTAVLPSMKLSDFSLSRYPYADDYFRFSDGAGSVGMPLPVRWLASEALFGGRYSEASDAWSYGVLLWELYCGQALTRPFEDLSDERLIDAMAGRTGRRPTLPCIRGCPPATYALMTECWKDLPVRRPRFGTILDRLEGGPPRGNELDVSPVAGSDSTGVTVVASMSESPQLSAGDRTSSFRTFSKTGSHAPGTARHQFSPATGRYLPRRTGSPLVPRSNSVTSADSAAFNVLM